MRLKYKFRNKRPKHKKNIKFNFLVHLPIQAWAVEKIWRRISHAWAPLKGQTYEIDFENVDKNWQILALTRAPAGCWIFQRHLWFLVEIKHLFEISWDTPFKGTGSLAGRICRQCANSHSKTPAVSQSTFIIGQYIPVYVLGMELAETDKISS